MLFNIGVVGAGALGTAIAQLVSVNCDKVYLHARRENIVKEINSTHINSEYYPNLILNDNITAVNNFDIFKDVKIIFLSVPSSAIRSTVKELVNFISDDCVLVSTAKGVEYPSCKTMGEIIEEYTNSAVALSGPNFASEIAFNQFTASDIAGESDSDLDLVEKVLSTPVFRVHRNHDRRGTELCGVIKNINAIAYGICEGMDLNLNARYAILTKGFCETQAILEALGCKKSTVDGYCGFGDIVLTSTNSESRNHTLGMLYGQRIIVDEKASGIIFEGKNSIIAVKKLCDENNIQSCIVDFVYSVIVDDMLPNIAFKKLWEDIE